MRLNVRIGVSILHASVSCKDIERSMCAGSHLSSSASLDAEDSTATAAAGSPVETRPSGKRHKSEVWRQKNRQAQKNFRQRKKVPPRREAPRHIAAYTVCDAIPVTHGFLQLALPKDSTRHSVSARLQVY